MFKILIADDEKFIRRGIISILTRGLEEEVQCVEAGNGTAALALAKSQVFHLIISDISMPGCNGLEFIRQLKESGQGVTVIIISGYENFEYAKQAIRLGVKEYVMKPIKKEEFLELIRGCIREIRKSREESLETVRKKRENDVLLEQVRKEVLVQLFTETRTEVIGQCLERLERFGITFRSSLFVCAAVEYEVTDNNREYIDFAAKNIVDEYLAAAGEHIITAGYQEGILALILEFQDQGMRKQETLQRFQETAELIARYCKVKSFVGIGDIAYDAAGLNRSMRHALKAADFKIYESGERVCWYQELERGREYELLPADSLLKELDEGHSVLAVNAFEALIREPVSRHALEAVRGSYEAFCLALRAKAEKLPVNAGEQRISFSPFSAFWGFLPMKLEIKRSIGRVHQMAQQMEDSLNTNLAQDMISYIQEHITEDLDLNTMADHFSKTPGYIGTLFKKATNSGFSCYITNERIKIAKRLLADSTIPIRKVGVLCGYPNSKYFSVVFKKATGENPKRYREKIEKDKNQ